MPARRPGLRIIFWPGQMAGSCGSGRCGWEGILTTQDHEHEVERLRSEVSELKGKLAEAQAQARAAETAQQAGAGAALAGATARRRRGWRGPVAVLLIVLACVLAPVSVLAVWTANQVSNTSRYVENVSPLIREPAVRSALTDRISKAVSDQVNVQSVTKQAAAQLSARGLTRLGSLVSSFSGSIASGVNSFIHSTVAKIVSSPQVTRLWIQANRIAHTQLVKALSGQPSNITVSNGQVVIGLEPIINQVKSNLAARGLTIVDKLPPINPTFPVFSAKYLVQARSLYRLLNTLKWALPLLALIFFAAGIYIARRHRRALIGAGLGLAASMLVLGAALAIGRTIYISKLPSGVSAEAASVAFDTIVRFIKQGLRVLLVLGLIVALAGFFTGPSVTAVRTREALKSAFGWIRGTGERAGVTTGPVGAWVYRYRTALRIGAVALAGLIFIFWTTPTGLVVLGIAIVLVVVLGLIELIGRPFGAAQARRAGRDRPEVTDRANQRFLLIGCSCG